jgi:hypothetical protein
VSNLVTFLAFSREEKTSGLYHRKRFCNLEEGTRRRLVSFPAQKLGDQCKLVFALQCDTSHVLKEDILEW